MAVLAVISVPPLTAQERSTRDAITVDSRGAGDRPDAMKALPETFVEHLAAALTLRDYNTRVVLFGASLMGVAAGLVGVFMLLRRRSLVSDVVSHASLPGIAIAFLVGEYLWPGSGKSLPVLLTGAAVTGTLGMLTAMAIRKTTRIKEDAALAIVLSVFFGGGIALFTIVQNIPSGNAAGLNHFIFGKASSMLAADVGWIAAAAAVVLIACGVLFKEFSLLAFDEKFAIAQGWPAVRLDLLLMGLVVGVTVVALQSVGLLLAVAMLIIPAAAARFWTDDLRKLAATAMAIGGASAAIGVLTSSLYPRLATGAIIVLTGSLMFFVSLLFGRQRGAVLRWLQRRRIRGKVGRHHMLRAFYEHLEAEHPPETLHDPAVLSRHAVPLETLLRMRTWSRRRLGRLLDIGLREQLICDDPGGGYRLTRRGAVESRRIVRDHRLWELYLIEYADIAPTHVDRDADQIEHILEPEVLDELEALLAKRHPRMTFPANPHASSP